MSLKQIKFYPARHRWVRIGPWQTTVAGPIRIQFMRLSGKTTYRCMRETRHFTRPRLSPELYIFIIIVIDFMVTPAGAKRAIVAQGYWFPVSALDFKLLRCGFNVFTVGLRWSNCPFLIDFCRSFSGKPATRMTSVINSFYVLLYWLWEEVSVGFVFLNPTLTMAPLSRGDQRNSCNVGVCLKCRNSCLRCLSRHSYYKWLRRLGYDITWRLRELIPRSKVDVWNHVSSTMEA